MGGTTDQADAKGRWSILTLSTIAFTLLFGVWLMLGVLAIKIKAELNFGDVQMEWLIAAAILAGALPRMNFGIWSDRFGGKRTMIAILLFCAIPTYLFSRAVEYWQFVACALCYGVAGNAFTAGISWNSAWFPRDQKGLALGVFGGGNVGASATKLMVILTPGVLTMVPAAGYSGGVIPGGWRFIPALYSVLLVAMAAAVSILTPGVERKPGAGRTMGELLRPLRHVRVWRFSLYYVVVFGAYVALSGWLPTFYTKTYHVPLHTAALLTAVFIFPASLLRPLGGWLSDRYGPRVVTYSVFLAMSLGLLFLCLPSGAYFGQKYDPGVGLFTSVLFVVACAMGIGKGSVYKYVPDYFPEDVGAVGGLVGALGALGGFYLPPLFGFLGRATGQPRMAFGAVLVLTVASLAWLHWTVVAIKLRERKASVVPGMIPEGIAP